MAATDVTPDSAPRKLSPWAFIPLLYFMQAIPVTIVQEVATVFFKDLGIANEPIVRWTSLISLPWSMQLLLGPLVDLTGTKRRWILGGQAMIAAGLIGTAFVLQIPNFFLISLLILGATAVVSALTNIATDGFYILSMPKDSQAKFIGVQTTCYRLGRLFCTGILLFVVGRLMSFAPLPVQTQSGQFLLKAEPPVGVSQSTLRIDAGKLVAGDNKQEVLGKFDIPSGIYQLRVDATGTVYGLTVAGEKALGPLQAAPQLSAALQVMPAQTVPGMNPFHAWSLVLGAASGLYLLGRLVNQFTVPKPVEDRVTAGESGELGRNIARTLSIVLTAVAGYFTLSALVRMAAHGLWRTFDGSVPVQAEPGAPAVKLERFQGWRLPDEAGYLGIATPLSGVMAEVAQFAVCVALTLFGIRLIRRLVRNTPMAEAFSSFARQEQIGAILFFIFFYRFGEAMVSKMSPLFLKDSLAVGGMAIPNETLGLIKGIAGVLGIVFGGILGGLFVGRVGLRKAFWPLAIAMHTPNLLYVWAAATIPPVSAMYFVDFVDQFGYGFGFAGYMVYLMWVAQRNHFQTSHYAIGTGLGALTILTAGVLSGILQSNFGYLGFFISVIILTIPGMIALFLIPHDTPKGPILQTPSH